MEKAHLERCQKTVTASERRVTASERRETVWGNQREPLPAVSRPEGGVHSPQLSAAVDSKGLVTRPGPNPTPPFQQLWQSLKPEFQL